MKEFKQRTSEYTPDRKIYNIRGDFRMIGNTNLTLDDYDDEYNNSNRDMVYVDVDDDPNTLNSSSATLEFPQENPDVNHNCTNIIYAGLYWMGRAHNATSPNTFTVTKEVPGAGAPINVNHDQTVGHATNITYTNYRLTITRSGGYNNRTLTYTFTPTGSGNTVAFIYAHNSGNQTLQVRVNGGTATTVPTSSIDANNAYLSTPYTIYNETGGVILTVNRFRRIGRNSIVGVAYAYTNVSGTYYQPANITKNYDKSVVYLKHSSESGYTTISAQDVNFTKDIYYPTNTHGYMYSAYAEITDYVKDHGIGEYFVADIALNEGNGGNTGYFGGWGMVVVYENSKMKWRDVTIFDGYAYLPGQTNTYGELPVSGFRTAQSGNIDLKLGIIAGEGDISITGDVFQIRNHENTQWINLEHSGNTATNFFRGSIPGSNPRNPNLKNNTGLDIAEFTIDNTGNSIITNNQESTRFRYGNSNGTDTYIISCIAMAVDAYVPELEPFAYLGKVNGVTPTPDMVVHPGEEIEYCIAISNPGNEDIDNTVINIPLPFNATYVEGSVEGEVLPGSWVIEPNQPAEYNAETNSIYWDIGTIPNLLGDHQPLARLTFKVKVTTNCFYLTVDECSSSVDIVGTSSGVGATSGTEFTFHTFITGYQEGECAGEPIYGPLKIKIDATQFVLEHCGEFDPEEEGVFIVCHGEGTIATDFFNNTIKPFFPIGTRFWSSYTINEDGYVIPGNDATEYTADNPFPISELGEKTYYAIPPGLSACVWTFAISVEVCANYWVGSNGDGGTAWNTASNWSRNEVPGAEEDIEFATVNNNNGQAAKNHLYVPANDPKVINNLINATDKDLVVAPASFLTIKGTITDNNVGGGTIIVQADPDDLQPAGTLIFTTLTGNENVAATAQFYSWAHQCSDCGLYRRSWQYFGIPVQSAATFPVADVDGNETINQWVEPFNGNQWQTAPYAPDTELKAFKGYEITNDATTQPAGVYSFAGTLNVGNATVPLTRTANVNYPGVNLVGNSFTAAIPISEDAFVFPANVNQTLYLFNTGTYDGWRKLNGTTVTGHKSGQYLAVPVNVGGQSNLPDRIPSTHAFVVLGEETFTSGNLTINYNKLVKNDKVNLGDGTMIVTRTATDEQSTTVKKAALPNLTMDVIGRESVDRVWLFVNERTTHGYDNGWDAQKIGESDIVQLYVQGTDAKRMQVATGPGLNNVLLGFEAEADGEYTLEFALCEQLKGEDIYLNDLLTGERVKISDNSSYTFEAKKGDVSTRFRLASGNIIKDDEASKITVYANENDGSVVINNLTEKDCTVYISDTSGRLLQSMEVKAKTEKSVKELPKGTLVVRIQNATVNDIRRVVVK